MFAIGLIFVLLTGNNEAFEEISSGLVSASLYIIFPVVFLYRLFPLMYIKRAKKANRFAAAMLDYSMGFVRTFSAFCIFLIIFLIFNHDHPNFDESVSCVFVMLICLTLFLLYMNTTSRYYMQKYQ
ncbi:hypothetical protein CGK15_23890 [Vibrio parahaemolyticus]|nr:hypothetical protein CGK15_23890 [Vibrio parahaemolyticus]TOI59563.1 hypothetical protein CGI56_23475 [Vibrio parahaemolyticus]